MIRRDKSGALGNVLGRWEKDQRNKIPAVSWSPGRNSVKSSVCRPGRVKEKVEGSEGQPENKLSICPSVQNTLPRVFILRLHISMLWGTWNYLYHCFMTEKQHTLL